MLVGFNSVLTTQLLTPIGKEKYVLIMVLIGMGCSLVLNFCLIPLFSYIGAAITSIITETVVTIISFYYSRKFISLSFDTSIFFRCLMGACLFIPLSYLLNKINMSYILREVIVIVICTIVYVIYIWFCTNNIYINSFKHYILQKVKTVYSSSPQNS
jgi:O-antigen/teichoic acid export membrane protein